MESDINIPIQPEPMNWGKITEPLVRQTGNEDLVQQLMVEFLDPAKNKLGFDERKIDKGLSLEEGLKRFLSGVLKNRRKDCNRSVARDRSRLMSLDSGKGRGGGDDDRPFESKELASAFRSPDYDLMAEQFRLGLIGLDPDDSDAEKVVKAALDITGGGRVHQELAESAFGTAKQAKRARNAIKRIQRRLENEERNGRNLPWMITPTTAPHNRTPGPTL